MEIFFLYIQPLKNMKKKTTKTATISCLVCLHHEYQTTYVKYTKTKKKIENNKPEIHVVYKILVYGKKCTCTEFLYFILVTKKMKKKENCSVKPFPLNI